MKKIISISDITTKKPELNGMFETIKENIIGGEAEIIVKTSNDLDNELNLYQKRIESTQNYFNFYVNSVHKLTFRYNNHEVEGLSQIYSESNRHIYVNQEAILLVYPETVCSYSVLDKEWITMPIADSSIEWKIIEQCFFRTKKEFNMLAHFHKLYQSSEDQAKFFELCNKHQLKIEANMNNPVKEGRLIVIPVINYMDTVDFNEKFINDMGASYTAPLFLNNDKKNSFLSDVILKEYQQSISQINELFIIIPTVLLTSFNGEYAIQIVVKLQDFYHQYFYTNKKSPKLKYEFVDQQGALILDTQKKSDWLNMLNQFGQVDHTESHSNHLKFTNDSHFKPNIKPKSIMSSQQNQRNASYFWETYAKDIQEHKRDEVSAATHQDLNQLKINIKEKGEFLAKAKLEKDNKFSKYIKLEKELSPDEKKTIIENCDNDINQNKQNLEAYMRRFHDLQAKRKDIGLVQQELTRLKKSEKKLKDIKWFLELKPQYQIYENRLKKWRFLRFVDRLRLYSSQLKLETDQQYDLKATIIKACQHVMNQSSQSESDVIPTQPKDESVIQMVEYIIDFQTEKEYVG